MAALVQGAVCLVRCSAGFVGRVLALVASLLSSLECGALYLHVTARSELQSIKSSDVSDWDVLKLSCNQVEVVAGLTSSTE